MGDNLMYTLPIILNKITLLLIKSICVKAKTKKNLMKIRNFLSKGRSLNFWDQNISQSNVPSLPTYTAFSLYEIYVALVKFLMPIH